MILSLGNCLVTLRMNVSVGVNGSFMMIVAGRGYIQILTLEKEKNQKKMSPLIRIIIIIFGGLLIYTFIIRGITSLVIGALYLGQYGIYLFPIFVVVCFAIIIGLWYKFLSGALNILNCYFYFIKEGCIHYFGAFFF